MDTDSSRLSTSERVLRACGVSAPIVLALAVTIAGSLHPDYSHLSQMISELGAKEAPYRTILNFGGLIPAGALTFMFSIAMFRRISGNLSLRLCAGLVATVGLGRFFAGLFPCDPGCLNYTSHSAQIHAVAAIMALPSGAVAPLVMAFGLRSRPRHRYFWLSLILGIGAVSVLITGMSQLWPPYVGAIQRLLLALTYVWIIAVALRLGKITQSESILP